MWHVEPPLSLTHLLAHCANLLRLIIILYSQLLCSHHSVVSWLTWIKCISVRPSPVHDHILTMCLWCVQCGPAVWHWPDGHPGPPWVGHHWLETELWGDDSESPDTGDCSEGHGQVGTDRNVHVTLLTVYLHAHSAYLCLVINVPNLSISITFSCMYLFVCQKTGMLAFCWKFVVLSFERCYIGILCYKSWLSVKLPCLPVTYITLTDIYFFII